jgi:hypothetical protein
MPNYQASRSEETFQVSYAVFTSAFESLLGSTDVAAFSENTTAERERLASFVGPLDFSLFQKIDHGALRTNIAGKPTLAMTYVFGNALIAIEMTKLDPRAGLYVPLRLFVQETAKDRVLATYDLPSAAMAQFGSQAIDEVARSLDSKVRHLLTETVSRAAAHR